MKLKKKRQNLATSRRRRTFFKKKRRSLAFRWRRRAFFKKKRQLLVFSWRRHTFFKNLSLKANVFKKSVFKISKKKFSIKNRFMKLRVRKYQSKNVLLEFSRSQKHLNHFKKKVRLKRQRFFRHLYFRNLDGLFHSFWVGKLINFFIMNGKKTFISTQVYKSLLLCKFCNKMQPLTLFLEILDQLKPLVLLTNWYRGRKMRVYPRPAKNYLRCKFALNWFVTELKKNDMKINRVTLPFFFRIYIKFLEFRKKEKHPIFALRRKYTYNAVRLQSNMRLRYPWLRI